MLNEFFKSIIDQDATSIVICDLEHTICYMNPAAVNNYAKRGGAALLGRNLKDCHNPDSGKKIDKVIEWFRSDINHNRIFTFHSDKDNKDVYMVALRKEDGTLIGYYEKHEYRNLETAKPYEF